MHQSFEPHTPLPLHTGAKILSEVPALWYSAGQTKVPRVESAVTAFLKSSHQTLKSVSKRRKRERELRK